jgi:hypothetical protein
MTATEFRAWLERRGLNYSQAAPLLAADHTEVMRWAKGERGISRKVARLVELLDKYEHDTVEMSNIRAWWAELTWDQRRGVLMRGNPDGCPCGDGTIKGHPYAWCMPFPSWLPRK